MKLYGARISTPEGLVYVCFGAHDNPRQLSCLVILEDSSVRQIVVTRQDLET